MRWLPIGVVCGGFFFFVTKILFHFSIISTKKNTKHCKAVSNYVCLKPLQCRGSWRRRGGAVITAVCTPLEDWRPSVKQTRARKSYAFHTEIISILNTAPANQITRQLIQGRRALWFLWRGDLVINGVYSNFISILAYNQTYQINTISKNNHPPPPCFHFKSKPNVQ